MLKTYILTSVLVSFLLLIILLNITTPATAGPLGILSVFIFAFLFLAGIISYVIFALTGIMGHLSMTFISRRPFEPLSLKKSYYYSMIISSAPIMLVALQSVGSVGIYEFVLVAIFVIIGSLYISKRSV